MKTRLLLSALMLKGALACCSLALADFHGTRGVAAEVVIKGKPLHLLGYQNTATNKATGPNAMFLPIPAKKGSMGPKNMLDATSCPHALEDITTAAQSGTRTILATTGEGNGVEVFDRGLYTVVLAQNANDIPQALQRVKPERRPAMAPEIFSAYSKWYPDWTFALCCFNSREATEGAPMLWWYEPLDPEVLFFPALDAHSGAPPDLSANVRVDHTLAVSVPSMSGGRPVNYRDKVAPAVAAYLPQRVVGGHLEGDRVNGDFVFVVKDVQAGRFSPYRVPPPGAR